MIAASIRNDGLASDITCSAAIILIPLFLTMIKVQTDKVFANFAFFKFSAAHLLLRVRAHFCRTVLEYEISFSEITRRRYTTQRKLYRRGGSQHLTRVGDLI